MAGQPDDRARARFSEHAQCLAILSGVTVDEFHRCVEAQDHAALVRVPGIGCRREGAATRCSDSRRRAHPSSARRETIGRFAHRIDTPVLEAMMELPPLNMPLARAMMSRTRVYRLLRGYRNLFTSLLLILACLLVVMLAGRLRPGRH